MGAPLFDEFHVFVELEQHGGRSPAGNSLRVRARVYKQVAF